MSRKKHGAKINKIFDKTNIEDKKVYRKGVFSQETDWKYVKYSVIRQKNTVSPSRLLVRSEASD